jgi:hypothetical protein
VEAVGFNGLPNGIGVNRQFSSDGADFPMLSVKVTANLGAGFWTDHLGFSSGSWNLWEGINEPAASAADDATQQLASTPFGPALDASDGRAGYAS